MNNKANIISAMVVYFVFILVWFAALGGYINTVGEAAVESGGMSGLEAFFYENLNVVIFIIMTISIVAYGVFTTEG